MTYVGIQYVNAQENIRHNLAVEAENVRHNKMTEDVSIATLGEAYRHNVASENISQQDVNIRRRAQDLAEREYVEVTKPRASAQIQLWNAQASEASAKTGLIKAQTMTESFKQNLTKAQTSTQISLGSKYNAEMQLTKAKTKAQEAEAKIAEAKVGSASKFYDVENNYLVQTFRSVFDTLGSLVHVRGSF